MRIGVPKEVKTAEFRVAITPVGVEQLVGSGHEVLVETSAGQASGFSDDQYLDAGAEIHLTAGDIWSSVDLILKVKEPIEPEYSYLEERGSELTLFTYLHLAGVPGLAEVLCRFGTTAIAYETVQLEDGAFPLLAPMSEIAGELAIQAGATYLQRPSGSKGLLISGASSGQPARVVVIGAGTVGAAAAKLALAMGADVTLLNRSARRLEQFASAGNPGKLTTELSTVESISAAVRNCDILVGGVYVGGAKADWVVTADMVRTMEPSSVIVDVSIDQGGCVETSRPTTYLDPVYVVDDVIHYCVANMPGAVPRTSTQALTNETLGYVLELANDGLDAATDRNPALKRGVNVYAGTVTNEPVAVATGLEYREFDELTAR
jgi:alanine dehydrogenase